MPRQGARISLILALVFPAIICAAIALAYYGYRYAVAASVRSKASLMEGNQQLAQLLIGQIQDHIDQVDFDFFQQVEGDVPAAARPRATAGRTTCAAWTGNHCSRGPTGRRGTSATCTSCSRGGRC